MIAPANAELFETPISTHWFNEKGILCSISKNVERTIEHYEKLMDLYARLTKNNNKLCLLVDATIIMPMNKEIREFLIREMPKFIKAQAIISDTPLTGMHTSAFIKLSWQGFPVKIFSAQKEAEEWLEGYL